MLSGKVRVALRILIVILLLFGFAVGGVYVGYNYVISQDKRFNALKSDIDAGKYKIYVVESDIDVTLEGTSVKGNFAITASLKDDSAILCTWQKSIKILLHA